MLFGVFLPLCLFVVSLSANASVVVLIFSLASLPDGLVVRVLSVFPVLALFLGLVGNPAIGAAEEWMVDFVSVAHTLSSVPVRNKRDCDEC